MKIKWSEWRLTYFYYNIKKQYITVVKICVCSSIVFDWPTYLCIQREVHVVICKTGKLLKDNMLFITPSYDNQSVFQMMQTSLI